MKHNNKYTKARIKQILCGIALLLCRVIGIVIACNAKESIGANVTWTLFTIPVGLALIFAKNIYID